jgi:hypothetical protein
MDAFKAHIDKMNGAEFVEFMKEHGLEKVTVWHQGAPDGSDLAIVLHEGPNPQKWITEGMSSPSPIAQQWRSMAADVHGMTPDTPMPKISELATFA